MPMDCVIPSLSLEMSILNGTELLTRTGLDRLGFAGLRPEWVQRMDAPGALDDLRRIGSAYAASLPLQDHLTGFI